MYQIDSKHFKQSKMAANAFYIFISFASVFVFPDYLLFDNGENTSKMVFTKQILKV